MKLARKIILGISLLLTACFEGPMNKFHDTVNDGTKVLKDGIVTGTENLKHIDLTGHGRLMDTIDALRKKIEEYQRVMSGLSDGTPMIVLKGSKVQLEITQCVGTFIANGWIDDQKNFFWQDKKYTDEGTDFPVDFNQLYSKFSNEKRAELTNQINASLSNPLINADLKSKMIEAAFPKYLWDNRGAMADFFNSQVKFIYYKEIAKGPFSAFPESHSTDLPQILCSSGQHLITISFTPMKFNANGNWKIGGRLITVSGSGEISILKEFYAESEMPKYSGIKPGETLPPIYPWIVVKGNDSKI